MLRQSFPVSVLVLALAVGCGRKSQGPEYSDLTQALKSRDEIKRGRATLDLITIGEPAVPALVALLSDPEPEARRVAASTLWGMGIKARGAVPQLAAALSDTDPEVRGRAAMALGVIGPEAREAVPALIRALRDRDVNVRLASINALKAMGPHAIEAVPALRRLVKHELLGLAAQEAVEHINAAMAQAQDQARLRAGVRR
jgi:HEAT repeat protein